jgi:hypothetical protein
MFLFLSCWKIRLGTIQPHKKISKVKKRLIDSVLGKEEPVLKAGLFDQDFNVNAKIIAFTPSG